MIMKKTVAKAKASKKTAKPAKAAKKPVKASKRTPAKTRAGRSKVDSVAPPIEPITSEENKTNVVIIEARAVELLYDAVSGEYTATIPSFRKTLRGITMRDVLAVARKVIREEVSKVSVPQPKGPAGETDVGVPLDRTAAETLRDDLTTPPAVTHFGAVGMTYGAHGTPLKGVAQTSKICVTCEEVTGGTEMVILRETAGSATLSCPHCGETIHCFSHEVPRKKAKP